MKERPILMSAPMALACLDGSKTQTRRTCKDQPPMGCSYVINGAKSHALCFETEHGCTADKAIWVPPTPKSVDHRLKCPYGVRGDFLFVKETFRPVGPWECRKRKETICYRADGAFLRKTGWPENYRIKTSDSISTWRPSIFMPRWASRITLEITEVRVERLNSISEEDAKVEGVKLHGTTRFENEARIAYQQLWESINGKGSWALNQFVWVIKFRRIKP